MRIAQTEIECKLGVIGDVEDDRLSLGADMESVGERLDPQLLLGPVGDLLVVEAHGEPVAGQVDDNREWLAVLALYLQSCVIGSHVSSQVRIRTDYPELDVVCEETPID